MIKAVVRKRKRSNQILTVKRRKKRLVPRKRRKVMEMIVEVKMMMMYGLNIVMIGQITVVNQEIIQHKQLEIY